MRYYVSGRNLIHIDNKPFECMEYPGFIIKLNKEGYNSIITICSEPDERGFSSFRHLNEWALIEDCAKIRIEDFEKRKYYILTRLRKKKLEKI